MIHTKRRLEPLLLMTRHARQRLEPSLTLERVWPPPHADTPIRQSADTLLHAYDPDAVNPSSARRAFRSFDTAAFITAFPECRQRIWRKFVSLSPLENRRPHIREKGPSKAFFSVDLLV